MLGFIPSNAKVKVFSAGKTDDFGLTVKEADSLEYNCNFRFNTDFKKIPVANGTEVVFTASIIFPQPLPIKVDDQIEFTDDLGYKQKKTVKLVQFKRDFANQVLAVKVVI